MIAARLVTRALRARAGSAVGFILTASGLAAGIVAWTAVIAWIMGVPFP